MSRQSNPEWPVIRSRRKTLELRVYPEGRVEIRAPFATSKKAIDAFVEDRRDWLNRKLEKTRQKQSRLPASWQCRDGSRLYLLGKPHELRLLSGRKAAWKEHDLLFLQLPEHWSDRYQGLLEGYFRQQARMYFERQIECWFPCFSARGCSRPVLRIRKMRSRWGSLSAKGYINLNLALFQYSPEYIEYVVVHELCHLLHMNHGPRFQKLQSELLPDAPARKQALERQARSLPSIFPS